MNDENNFDLCSILKFRFGFWTVFRTLPDFLSYLAFRACFLVSMFLSKLFSGIILLFILL